MGSSESKPKEPIVLDPMVMKYESDNDVWSEGKVTLGNGNVRNVMQWIPKSGNIKGLIVFVHGMNEHALVYDKLAHVFTGRGFACHGIDHYAHGLSATDDERGFMDNYHFLYQDLIEFVKYVRALPGNADLPLFIFAHSLGTVITTLALPKIDNVKAAIFNGAAFNPGPGGASPFGIGLLFPLTLTPITKSIARNGAINDPRGFVSYLWLEENTYEQSFVDKIRHDGRTYQGPGMNKPGFETLEIIDNARPKIKDINIPFFASHGAKDIITYPSGSRLLYNEASTPGLLKTLKIIPNCKHHTIHELDSVSKPVIEEYVRYYESFLKPVDTESVRAPSLTK